MLGVVGNSNAATHISRRKPLARSKSRREVSGNVRTTDASDASSRDGRLSRAQSRRLSRSGSQIGLFHPMEALQEPLPPAEHWIHSGRLRKRVAAQDISWQERLVVLTKDAVFLSRMDTRRVGESIPLLEITSLEKVKADDPNVMNNAAQEVQARRRALASNPAEGATESWRSRTFLSRGASQPGTVFVLEIFTSLDGHFNGRTYSLRCESERDCDEWISKIEGVRTEAGAREEAANKSSKTYESWVKVQAACHRAYHWALLQVTMALLVALNFAIAIAEAQRVPDRESDEWWYFYHGELFFTSAFAVELAINMVGHWFKPFWEDRWNVFDVFIVACSVVVIPLSDLPGFAILRLFRVFRIMRLFRMMKPLRVLIRALAASVVPVINAFAVLFIITCLYAVIGVQLFGTKTPDRFDRFSNAFFTMIQVCTGDGWAEAVVRPMWDQYTGPQVSVFFVSYILIAGTFLLNIVVAVLLDEFITSVEKDKQTPIEEARLANEAEFFKNESPLDPLVSTLTQFTSNEDLDKQIQDIFELLDPNEKGAISFKELQDGLRRLPFEPPIVLTSDDFQEIAQHHNLRSSGLIDAGAFTFMMRKQLRRFVQKYLNLKCMDGSQDNTWLILSLKQMLLSDSQAEREEREEHMERMVQAVHDDVAQIKQALLAPLSREASTHEPHLESMNGSFKSSFRSSRLPVAPAPDSRLFATKRRASFLSTRRSSLASHASAQDQDAATDVGLGPTVNASNDNGIEPDKTTSVGGSTLTVVPAGLQSSPLPPLDDDPPLPAALFRKPSPHVIGTSPVLVPIAAAEKKEEEEEEEEELHVFGQGGSVATGHRQHGHGGVRAGVAGASSDETEEGHVGEQETSQQEEVKREANIDSTIEIVTVRDDAESEALLLQDTVPVTHIDGLQDNGVIGNTQSVQLFHPWGDGYEKSASRRGSWRGRMLEDTWRDTLQSTVWAETHGAVPSAGITAQLVVPTSAAATGQHWQAQ